MCGTRVGNSKSQHSADVRITTSGVCTPHTGGSTRTHPSPRVFSLSTAWSIVGGGSVAFLVPKMRLMAAARHTSLAQAGGQEGGVEARRRMSSGGAPPESWPGSLCSCCQVHMARLHTHHVSKAAGGGVTHRGAKDRGWRAGGEAAGAAAAIKLSLGCADCPEAGGERCVCTPRCSRSSAGLGMRAASSETLEV